MKPILICASLMFTASTSALAQAQHVHTTQLRCQFQTWDADRARIFITNDSVRRIPRTAPLVVTQSVKGVMPRRATVTLRDDLAPGQTGEAGSPFTADPQHVRPRTYSCAAVADWVDFRNLRP